MPETGKNPELCSELEKKAKAKRVYLSGVLVRYIHLGYHQDPKCEVAIHVLYKFLWTQYEVAVLKFHFNDRQIIRYEWEIERQVVYALDHYEPGDPNFTLSLLRRIIWEQAPAGATATLDGNRPEGPFDENPPGDDDEKRPGHILFPDIPRDAVEQDIIRRDTQKFIFSKIDELDEQRKYVVYAYYFEDKKLQQIAKEIGKPYSTTRSWLVKALEELREKLIDFESETLEEDTEWNVWTKTSHLNR